MFLLSRNAVPPGPFFQASYDFFFNLPNDELWHTLLVFAIIDSTISSFRQALYTGKGREFTKPIRTLRHRTRRRVFPLSSSGADGQVRGRRPFPSRRFEVSGERNFVRLRLTPSLFS